MWSHLIYAVIPHTLLGLVLFVDSECQLSELWRCEGHSRCEPYCEL